MIWFLRIKNIVKLNSFLLCLCVVGIPCSIYAQDSFIITRGFLDADTERMGIHNPSDPGSPPVITGWGFSTYASVSWDGSKKAYFKYGRGQRVLHVQYR
jgi:hypothetical protein